MKPLTTTQLAALRDAPLGTAPADILAAAIARVRRAAAQAPVQVARFGSSI